MFGGNPGGREGKDGRLRCWNKNKFPYFTQDSGAIIMLLTQVGGFLESALSEAGEDRF